MSLQEWVASRVLPSIYNREGILLCAEVQLEIPAVGGMQPLHFLEVLQVVVGCYSIKLLIVQHY